MQGKKRVRFEGGREATMNCATRRNEVRRREEGADREPRAKRRRGEGAERRERRRGGRGERGREGSGEVGH